MNKLEALADAVMEYNGFRDPRTAFYKLRNPGGLKAYSERKPQDLNGYRYFKSFIDGYTALLYDLRKKCSGESNCGLKPDTPFYELVRVYGMRDETTRYLVTFLRKALSTDALSDDMPISLFLE